MLLFKILHMLLKEIGFLNYFNLAFLLHFMIFNVQVGLYAQVTS